MDKEDAVNWICKMVSLKRLLPIEYRTIYNAICNGSLPEIFPDGCKDIKAVHEYAKAEALEMAHHWVFSKGEYDDYDTMTEEECKSVLYERAIDKLMDADHDTWMEVA